MNRALFALPRLLIAFITVLLLGGYGSDLLQADNCIWNASTGGTFSESVNWASSAGPPTVDDYVTFNLESNYAILFTDNAVSVSVFVENDQTLLLLDGYNYAVSANTVVGWHSGESGRLEVVGGLVTTKDAHVGYSGTATGTLVLSDHATLEVANLLDIANTGDTNGHISVAESSSLSCASMVIGGDVNATGSLQVSGVGSTFDCSGEITVGNLARGVMLVEQGGAATSVSAVIGSGTDPGQIEKALGNVVVSDNNSQWINSGSLTVGNSDTAEGSLAVANGGYVENQDATLGVAADARGMVIVEGAGAKWQCNSLLTVGHNGSGTLSISSGGGLSTVGTDIAALTGSTGTALLSGESSTWNETLDLNVGGTSGASGGSGSLSVTSGADLSVIGELRIHDDSSFTLDNATVVAGSFVTSGNAQIDFNDGSLTVAGGVFDNSAEPDTTIDGSSAAALPTLRLVGGANGTVDQCLTVGSNGRGAMEIRGGSTMVANQGSIGFHTDSQGIVTVSDPASQWQISGVLSVGDRGAGELNILAGATVQSRETLVGCNSGADGKIVVDGNGSTLSCNYFDVGGNSTGFVGAATISVQNDGAVVVAQDLEIWSLGNVYLNGGTMSVAGAFDCDGTFDFNAGTLSVGQISSINGTFNYTGGDLNITAAGLNIGDSQPLGDSLELVSGQHIDVAYQAVVDSGAWLRVGNGASFAANEILNYGELDMSGSTSQLRAANLMNIGLLHGNGRVEAALQNHSDGQIRVESGNRIVIDADSITSINNGTIDMAGGTFECTQAFTNSSSGFIAGRGTMRFGTQLQNDGNIVLSGGFSDIHGDVVNDSGSSTIVITGGSVATFYDDIHSDGLIRVSAACAAVFLGEFSGSGGTSGTGTVYFEGDLRPGNSPARVSFGGDLVLGSNATLDIEIGGTLADTEHDVIDVAGQLSLDGTLNITLIDGFIPLPSQTFDILDFGSLTGGFSQLNLPGLDVYQEWDISDIYTTGQLAVIQNDPIPGDANYDGTVDNSDAAILAANLAKRPWSRLGARRFSMATG